MQFSTEQLDKERTILQFISGKAVSNTCWLKNLLYSLMYKECHSKPLRKIILEDHVNAN